MNDPLLVKITNNRGEEYRVYASGRVKGFGENPRVQMRLGDLLVEEVNRYKNWLELHDERVVECVNPEHEWMGPTHYAEDGCVEAEAKAEALLKR